MTPTLPEVSPDPPEKTNSPFRYPGGKFYARPKILRATPPHTQYCEPFAGGASVFFAKPKAHTNILNDLDRDVINTIRHIRDNVEGLIAMLRGIPATKDNHHYYKTQYSPRNDMERAFRWFYLNRTSYSGIMRPENCYWGYGGQVLDATGKLATPPPHGISQAPRGPAFQPRLRGSDRRFA